MGWAELLRKTATLARKSVEELAAALSRSPHGKPSYEPAYSRYRNNQKFPVPSTQRRQFSTTCGAQNSSSFPCFSSNVYYRRVTRDPGMSYRYCHMWGHRRTMDDSIREWKQWNKLWRSAHEAHWKHASNWKAEYDWHSKFTEDWGHEWLKFSRDWHREFHRKFDGEFYSQSRFRKRHRSRFRFHGHRSPHFFPTWWVLFWLKFCMSHARRSLGNRQISAVSIPSYYRLNRTLPIFLTGIKDASQMESDAETNRKVKGYHRISHYSFMLSKPRSRTSSSDVRYDDASSTETSKSNGSLLEACSTLLSSSSNLTRDYRANLAKRKPQLSLKTESTEQSDDYSRFGLESSDANLTSGGAGEAILRELGAIASAEREPTVQEPESSSSFAAVDFDIGTSPHLNLPEVSELTDTVVATIKSKIMRQISSLQTMLADISLISEFGELPVTVERDGEVLRVHFPNSDADRVATLVKDKGIEGGEIIEVPATGERNWEPRRSDSESSFELVSSVPEESIDDLWSVLNSQPPALTEEVTSVSDNPTLQTIA